MCGPSYECSFITAEVEVWGNNSSFQYKLIYSSRRAAASHDPLDDVNCLKFLSILALCPWPAGCVWSLSYHCKRSCVCLYNDEHKFNPVWKAGFGVWSQYQKVHQAGFEVLLWKWPQYQAHFETIAFGTSALLTLGRQSSQLCIRPRLEL